MAKLTRESRLRERRLDKQAKKEARKLAPAHDPDAPGDSLDGLDATTSESAATGSGQTALETVNQTPLDA